MRYICVGGVVGIALAAAMWPLPAFAYIDPGTGSYVVQIIIAAIVGGGFALKIFWRRIADAVRSLFSGKKRNDG